MRARALIWLSAMRCHVLDFTLTVLLLELTPGPNMAYLATLTLDRGRPAGLLATAGVAAGLSVHAIVAAFGLGVLISLAPLSYDLLRWTGVAYLLYLAWETWQSDENTPSDIATMASTSLFWRGFFSNVFNPKSIMFFVSVVPGFIHNDPGGPDLLFQAARLGAIYIAIATSIHLGIVLLAAQLRPLLTAGVHRGSVRRILALALVLVAVWLAWSTRRT
ncbi:MAG TPA: LysE family translocator [Sphingomicrobium sp.]|nr:LysE family translocator [Sphingomicrobium sp.]